MDIYYYEPSEEAIQAANGSQRGSYKYALGNRRTNRIWPNWAAFEMWLADEVEKGGFQFRIRGSETGVHYHESFTLVCRRQATGGPKVYQRKTEKKIKPSCKVIFALNQKLY